MTRSDDVHVSAPKGHGVGLRRQHFAEILDVGVQDVPWMEIISENFFEPGGRPWAVLNRVRQDVPVAMHGVALGIGNAGELDENYLQKLEDVVARIEPESVSDHLCWGAFQGHHGHDLWPLPYTAEALQHVVERVGRVQDRLKRRIMLENVSSYVSYEASEMSEHEFLVAVATTADCGILLDVNNVFVSARNHGFDPRSYIDAVPQDRVGQLHLAGHTDHGDFILDSHIGPVPDSVWDLYRHTVRRFGEVPSLVEWDEEIPAYAELVREAKIAETIEAQILATPRPDTKSTHQRSEAGA